MATDRNMTSALSPLLERGAKKSNMLTIRFNLFTYLEWNVISMYKQLDDFAMAV